MITGEVRISASLSTEEIAFFAIQVAVHNPGTAPRMNSEAFSVAAGSTTTVAVSFTKVTDPSKFYHQQ